MHHHRAVTSQPLFFTGSCQAVTVHRLVHHQSFTITSLRHYCAAPKLQEHHVSAIFTLKKGFCTVTTPLVSTWIYSTHHDNDPPAISRPTYFPPGHWRLTAMKQP
jgi:hypothetical protein